MESSRQIEERAAEWVAKRDGGSWTDADEAALARWLAASTANRVAFLRLDAAWQQANRLKALGAGIPPGAIPTPGKWRHSPYFEQRRSVASASTGAEIFSRPSGRSFGHPNRALAASVVVAVVLAAGWYFWPTGPTYRTPIGGLAAVPLPDGSQATLNTDSEIRVAITDTQRLVNLEQGEAFFAVARDPNRPFVVDAGNQRFIAVGTEFSVRRDKEVSRLVVTKGRVRVESTGQGLVRSTAPATEVSAGGIAISGKTGVLVQEKPLPEAEAYLSWRSGYLIFKDTPLAEAVDEFNRYNTNKIVIEDAYVAGIRIGGNFRSTNVDAFIRLLEDGFPIHVEQQDDRIILTKT